MTVLVATSVVRGSRQGESHGGVFLVDFAQGRAAQTLDWNTMNIDWQGRGWDRGLRGIELDGEVVYIAASDELFAYTPDFRLLGSWRNPYLKHCHEISRHERTIFLTSTGFEADRALAGLKRGARQQPTRKRSNAATVHAFPRAPVRAREPLMP